LKTFFENILPTNESGDADLPSSLSYFAFGVPALVLGTVCFFLADWIVKLAYRDSSRNASRLPKQTRRQIQRLIEGKPLKRRGFLSS